LNKLEKDLIENVTQTSTFTFTDQKKNIYKEFAVFTGFWPKYDLEINVDVKSQTTIL
jgi:hypothetical protein